MIKKMLPLPEAPKEVSANTLFVECPITLSEFDNRFKEKTYHSMYSPYNKTSKAGTFPLYVVDYKEPSTSYEVVKMQLILIGSLFFEEGSGTEGVCFIKKSCPERLAIENNADNIIAEVESTDGPNKIKYVLFAETLPHPELLINFLNSFNQLNLSKINIFYRV